MAITPRDGWLHFTICCLVAKSNAWCVLRFQNNERTVHGFQTFDDGLFPSHLERTMEFTQ
jgi:hypothetical protein